MLCNTMGREKNARFHSRARVLHCPIPIGSCRIPFSSAQIRNNDENNDFQFTVQSYKVGKLKFAGFSFISFTNGLVKPVNSETRQGTYF